MNVVISVKGRFHAFYLAHQIQQRGYLNELITTYPKFETKKYGIQSNKIKSLISHELLDRVLRKYSNKYTYNNCQFFLREIFDRHAAMKIRSDADIFVGWSSNSLHSIRRAKKNGIKTIVERGSSHIEFQNQILSEEYGLFGLKYSGIPSEIIEKEIKEYDESDYISVPSTYVKRTFLEKNIEENKIIQIPYGVNLSNFYKVPKNDNIFRVIFCGAISLRKGVQYLLKAFHELNLPNSELILIGSVQKEMEKILDKYKKENIIYTGTLPEKELYKYYSQGSVFCLPSIEEGLAMVQVQALACGLPLICTTNTGGEDLIDDGKQGFVGPIRDVEFLKNKIVTLYEDSELTSYMADEAMRKVSQEFTWKNYGDKVIKYYMDIIE